MKKTILVMVAMVIVTICVCAQAQETVHKTRPQIESVALLPIYQTADFERYAKKWYRTSQWKKICGITFVSSAALAVVAGTQTIDFGGEAYVVFGGLSLASIVGWTVCDFRMDAIHRKWLLSVCPNGVKMTF